MNYSTEGIEVAPKTSDIRFERADHLEFCSGEITLEKSPTADTRSAKTKVDHTTLLNSSSMHIEDVRKAMAIFETELADRAQLHDWTKIQFSTEFHKQFAHAQETGEWPKGMEWWYDRIHIKERHHLKDRVPKDVDLFDVLEMIADCCTAGMARSGKYRKEDPDNIKDILKEAYDNTIEKLLKKIKVSDPQKGV